MMTITSPLDAWAPPSARLEPDQLRAGQRGRIVVTIDVPDGCHVQSARPAERFLIPTTVELEAPAGVTIGEAVYPPVEHQHYEWTPVEQTIYRSTVEVVVPVEVESNVPPAVLPIMGRVRFQGCTETSCLPPVERTLEMELSIRLAQRTSGPLVASLTRPRSCTALGAQAVTSVTAFSTAFAARTLRRWCRSRTGARATAAE